MGLRIDHTDQVSRYPENKLHDAFCLGGSQFVQPGHGDNEHGQSSEF